MSYSLQPHGLYSRWNSPGQNTRVGSLSLLQGIFPTQGLHLGLPHCRRILNLQEYWSRYPIPSPVGQEESNRGFLHCRWILYQLNYQGSPKKKQ